MGVTKYLDMSKKIAKCTAVVQHGRINLLIDKSTEGYDEFSKVFKSIDRKGRTILSFYAHVPDENGEESNDMGLIITSVKE